MARRIVQVLADLDVLRHDMRLLLAMVQRLDRTLTHASPKYGNSTKDHRIN
jgi:hypothetical protein